MTFAEREGIWDIAYFVRKKLNLTTPVTLDALVDAVEKLGGFCNRVEDQHGLQYDAVIRTKNIKSGKKFCIEYAGWKAEKRILFSIAHELGHLFLHCLGEDGSIKEEIHYRDLDTSKKELEANEFAAAMLMPTNEFLEVCDQNTEYSAAIQQNIINMDKVAEHFGVSVQAASVRRQILELGR